MLASAADVASFSLPQARRDSGCSLERALLARRTVREFAAAPLRLDEVAQLVWAAQGVIAASGRRTAPSAGALYPLEVQIVVGQAHGLEAGAYRYDPPAHRLVLIAEGDRRGHLGAAVWGQSWLQRAPAIFVIAAVARRTTVKYGERGVRYALMEAGHASAERASGGRARAGCGARRRLR